MKVVLSTRNVSKADQIKKLFTNPTVTIATLDELNILGEVVEDGKTLYENALKKANFARLHAPKDAWVVAEDTGLFIRALDGAPGIKAARWAGETATTDEITQFTLAKLKGIQDRFATFTTIAIVIDPTEGISIFEGSVDGHLAESPQAPAQPQMPYSPLFKPLGSDKVWAQMTIEEENALSHRGKAFRKVVEFLERQRVV